MNSLKTIAWIRLGGRPDDELVDQPVCNKLLAGASRVSRGHKRPDEDACPRALSRQLDRAQYSRVSLTLDLFRQLSCRCRIREGGNLKSASARSVTRLNAEREGKYEKEY